MAKPNELWSQFGASATVCKPGCNRHYPAQTTHMQQSSNLASVYGMLYEQNFRQESSRQSSAHVGNGSNPYIPSQQVPLHHGMPLSQQGYVGLPFSHYSLPLHHNFIHRPVAHVDTPRYYQGPHNYGSSSVSRRVTPYQRTLRPERRRVQESVRRGFELVRPDIDSSRRSSTTLRNMLDTLPSISGSSVTQSPVVSGANGCMTVRQFLSSWRDRDDEIPERSTTASVQNENYGLNSIPHQTQATPPSSQAETSSYLISSSNHQESAWVAEERRIERISNPDMIPLMYPLPQLDQIQPSVSHLPQPEPVQQIPQNQIGTSSGIAPHWQCLDLQGQQCYGGTNTNTDYRSDDVRPAIQSQRHYNLNSSIETGEIFDDINGTRDSRQRNPTTTFQPHNFTTRPSNNVYPSEDQRHWDPAMHATQNLNFSAMGGEGLTSHVGSIASGIAGSFYDSYQASTTNLVSNTLRNDITPSPAHPDTTTRDTQESTDNVTERPLSSEEINLSLAQADNVPTHQLCFSGENNAANENNLHVRVCVTEKIEQQIQRDIVIKTPLHLTAKSNLGNNDEADNEVIDVQNNSIINVDKVASRVARDMDRRNASNSPHSSESANDLSLSEDNQLPTLTYPDHSHFESIPAPELMLSCSDNEDEENMGPEIYVDCENISPNETVLDLTSVTPPLKLKNDSHKDNRDQNDEDEILALNKLDEDKVLALDTSGDKVLTLNTHGEDKDLALDTSDEDKVLALDLHDEDEVLALDTQNDDKIISLETHDDEDEVLILGTQFKTENSDPSQAEQTEQENGEMVELKEEEMETDFTNLKPDEEGIFNDTNCFQYVNHDDFGRKSIEDQSPQSPVSETKHPDNLFHDEIHHCVLCGRSFLTRENMLKHEQSPVHRRLEIIQRRAHHWAYYRATGSIDPNVPTLTPMDHEFLVYLPHVPGLRNYYHHSNNFSDID